MFKRFFAGTILTLVLMAAVVAPVAAATGIRYCFTINGVEHCINIPFAYKIIFKIPPDKPNALDVSRVLDSFEEVYRNDKGQSAWLQALVESQGQETQWFLVDASGKHVVAIDMVSQAAVEVQVDTEVGY